MVDWHKLKKLEYISYFSQGDICTVVVNLLGAPTKLIARSKDIIVKEVDGVKELYAPIWFHYQNMLLTDEEKGSINGQ